MFNTRLLEEHKSRIKTEFRNIAKNTNSIADFSFSSGHKSYRTDDKDSRSHLFAKSIIDLNSKHYDTSNLYINFEKTTNDTYLKLFKLESPLLIDRDLSTTTSHLNFTASKKELDIHSSISIYEKLSVSNSDRYEFILPAYSLSKTIDTADYPGFIEFYSSGSHNIFDTNKSETRLINDLNYASESLILNNGIKNDYDIFFKNSNAIGKKSSNFESYLNLLLH